MRRYGGSEEPKIRSMRRREEQEDDDDDDDDEEAKPKEDLGSRAQDPGERPTT